jgi:AcrR family transcriptional regulator
MAKTCRNRETLIERATALFASRPAEQMGFNAIAEACDVSMWALRYNFGDTETLFKAIADHLLETIEQVARKRPTATAQTIDALGAHADFLSGLFRSDAYRDLLILVLRAGRERPWLAASRRRWRRAGAAAA